jgi:putative endonuclease
MAYYVYILASGRNGTLYVGMTNEIARRVHEHKQGAVEGFTKKYAVHHLVHYDTFDEMADALARERRVKRWLRKWKLDLIEKNNPTWHDLYDDLTP